MKREANKLSPIAVRNASVPGLYGDGAGLWLNVGPTGGKSWLLRYMLDGRAREMGLGPLNTVGLSEARERARAARLLLLDGVDPLERRRAERDRRRAEAAKAVTFRKATETYIRAHRSAWRNEKHAWQWDQTMKAHAFPVIGDLPVSAIETGHVTRILEPIWTVKAETAARVRGRIENVLDYAKVHGWRTGENPARWKGHLENVLPARAKVSRVEHHAALPWAEIGRFMAELARQDGVAALALRFTILTAARTGEVIGATWDEFDIPAAVWTVPASRMKAEREHRVPLSSAALTILAEVAKLRPREGVAAPVFAGGRGGRATTGLSNTAMLMLLRRMNRGDLTVHGFRSTFRDWVAEATRHSREIAEAALAHVVESKVEGAYQRGDLLEKRRRLMNDWARFCGCAAPADSARVISIGARGQ